MMYFMMQLREALSNLLSGKLRSFLAILGILVGTGSVVAMVSSGQLATEQALAQFKQLGTDLLSVSFYQESSGQQAESSAQLSMEDVQNMPKFVPEINKISGYTMVYVPIAYDGNKIDTSIVGADSQLQDVIKVEIDKGRGLTFLDKNSTFCVIGKKVVKKLKDLGVFNPIGKQIQMGDVYFTIVGIAKEWQENSFFNQNINESILVPIQASMVLSKYTQISNIVMRLKPNVDIDATQNKIKAYIGKILPGQQFYFRSAKELVNSMAQQQKILTIMLGMIGGISLFVGGIGVMNIMLVSVVERRREIGIRKAVGAKIKDIQWLFLIESVTLTLFGGMVGVILGVLASFIISMFAGWHFTVFFLPPTIGFLVSVAVGIFFGFYPAYKAARLDPIQTLRSD